jgi:hypothetical protein
MPRGNAINHIDRRRLLLTLAVGSLLPAQVWAQEKKEKKKSDTPVEKPLVNTSLLVIDAVTAPISGPPGSKVIMTLTVDCGSIETARKVDDLMPRVYHAVILELNREPLGRDGRIFDNDIEGLKRRLVYQINRSLQGPQVVGVYIRSMQEVPLRAPSSGRS